MSNTYRLVAATSLRNEIFTTRRFETNYFKTAGHKSARCLFFDPVFICETQRSREIFNAFDNNAHRRTKKTETDAEAVDAVFGGIRKGLRITSRCYLVRRLLHISTAHL